MWEWRQGKKGHKGRREMPGYFNEAFVAGKGEEHRIF